MKTFNSIYNFEVFNKIKEGKKVCVCDRQFRRCDTLNGLTVSEALAIIADSETRKDRYEFWIEEETGGANNE